MAAETRGTHDTNSIVATGGTHDIDTVAIVAQGERAGHRNSCSNNMSYAGHTQRHALTHMQTHDMAEIMLHLISFPFITEISNHVNVSLFPASDRQTSRYIVIYS